MRKKMTDKHKLMAYVLSTDAELNEEKNITQREIADIFGVSQSAVAQGIKEAKLRLRINELEQELSQIKGEVMQLEGIDALALPQNIGSEYKRKL